MSDLLSTLAVGRKDSEDAQELLGAYLGTKPDMALNHTLEAKPAAPAPSAPALSAPGLGGGTTQRATAQTTAAGFTTPAVGRGPEYEVFRNDKNALAFFLYRQGALDGMSNDGPFWFQIERNTIVAGDDKHRIVFDDMSDELLGIATERGVILLIEFEEQQAVRCTPCYLTDSL